MQAEFDPRYLEGIRRFNEREYFACHDVLEDLWNDILGPERTFYQGLIHAAVACFHFESSNLTGARKMFHSSRDYLTPYGPRYLGLNVDGFLADLSLCFRELRAASGQYPSGLKLDPELLPVIKLTPDAEDQSATAS